MTVRKNKSRDLVSCRYAMLIQWSEEDKVYIVTLPEFSHALTHGKTYAEAARQGEELIESFVMWYEQDGRSLPKPDLYVGEGRRSRDLIEAT